MCLGRTLFGQRAIGDAAALNVRVIEEFVDGIVAHPGARNASEVALVLARVDSARMDGCRMGAKWGANEGKGAGDELGDIRESKQ